jgi:hypothetical protein
MAEELAPASTISPSCPWCSAALPSDHETSCPSCGATLVTDVEPQLPGVTAIDAEAIVRNARGATAPRRSRLLSWISGDVADDVAEAPARPESLAPPPLDVRREMLRMEIEAELSDLQAEAGAILAEEGLEAFEATDASAPGARPSAPSEPTPRPEA